MRGYTLQDDDECAFYYKIMVTEDDEKLFVFNHRTLVRDIESAKKFLTLRSAKRCIASSEHKNYEIIRFTNNT